MDEGPFDDVAAPPSAEAIEIEIQGGAVYVRHAGRFDLEGVGALLYEMLAGGPLHVAKDRPGAPPRPLAKLRAFLAGGPPLSRELVDLVEKLMASGFPDADAAIEAIDSLPSLVTDG